MMKKLIWLGLLILLTLTTNSFAQQAAIHTTTPPGVFELFPTNQANKELRTLNAKVTKSDIQMDELKKGIARLDALQDNAELCVRDATKQLKLIEEELNAATQAAKVSSKINNAENALLKSKHDFFVQQGAECRLFLLRSKETITSLNDTIQRLSTSQLLVRNLPFWSYFQKEQNLFNVFYQIDWTTVAESTGIQVFGKGEVWLGLLGLFILSLLLAQFLRKYQSKFSSVFYHYVFNYFSLALILFLSFTSSYFLILNWYIVPKPTLLWLFYGAVVYVITLSIVRLSLFHLLPSLSFLLSEDLRKTLHFRLVTLSTVLFLGTIFYVLLLSHELSAPFVAFGKTLLISLLSANIVWIAWLYNRIPVFVEKFASLKTLVNGFLLVILISILTTALLGFDNLALFLLTAVSGSIVLTFLAFFALKLINKRIDHFNRGSTVLSQKIRSFIGVKPYKRLPELFLFRLAGFTMVGFLYLLFSLQVWGASPNYLDLFVKGFTDGFAISQIQIFPLRVILASLFFPYLILGGRWISNYIKTHNQFEGEKDTQVAMASLTTYIVFGIAVVFSLLIGGINLTGLAIIAGALSVGIGLGLQSIVNNFVSGIILLLERPVKPGDRILIGNTEGIVKKIRIRSTQIRTSTRADVIVPNSDLITHQITNYMFKDPIFRVTCKLGVSYESNIHLVKELLLKVADEHPDVLKDSDNNNGPSVSFKEFGENSLTFELCCVIQDVNQKGRIKSDLNFAIAKILHEHDIELASPQWQPVINIKMEHENRTSRMFPKTVEIES